MEVLQNRTESFTKPKRIRNPTKSSSYISARWPHPPHFNATPATLAEAGFYYNPSFDDRDNVECYVCGKQLSDWEADDDPFDIHWEKCGATCCWASVRCGLRGDKDRHDRFVFPDKARLPTSKNMERARLETFSAGNGWVHDQDKNHGANSRKMARAGFIYTPQHPGDDLVTCLYCDVSLSGWDADDDPMEEHRKREKKTGYTCPFFSSSSSTSTSTSHPIKTQSKPASKAHPQQPKLPPPSRSKQQKHTDILLPTKTHDGDDADSDDPSTRMIPEKVNGRTASGSKLGAKTPRKLTRSQSRAGTDILNGSDENAENEDEGQASSLKLKTKMPADSKKSRSRSKSVPRPVVAVAEEDTEMREEDEVITVTRSKPKSKTKMGTGETLEHFEIDVPKKSSRSKQKSRVVSEEGEEVSTLRKPSRTQSKTKAATDRNEEDGIAEGLNQVAPGGTPPRKSSRTKSRATIVSDRDEAGAVQEGKELKSRVASRERPVPVSRKPSRTKPKPTVVVERMSAAQDEGDGEEEEEEEEEGAPSKVGPQKRELGRQSPFSTACTKPQSRPKAKSRSKAIPQEVHDDAEETEIEPTAPPFISPSPPSSTRQSSVNELPPLLVPKRKANIKGNGRDSEQEEMIAMSINAKQEGEREQGPEMRLVQLEKEEINEKGQVFAEIVQPTTMKAKAKTKVRAPIASPPSLPPAVSTPPIAADELDDEDMAGTEEKAEQGTEEEQRAEGGDGSLKTPPRFLSGHPTTLNTAPVIPALSKLPFTPLQNLTDAELDMTVEEWIRYQMGVEYDKFRRDGERELGRFTRRAEEVRRTIEAL